MTYQWYQNHNTVVALAEWLVERGDLVDNEALFYMLRKPWKYNNEYKEMTNGS